MVMLGGVCVCACLTPCPLRCLVPQGSVLSSVLFNIYMKLPGEIIQGFGVGAISMWMTPSSLSLSFQPVTKVTIEGLECSLEVVDSDEGQLICN